MLGWLSPATRRPESARNPTEKTHPESTESQPPSDEQQQQQPQPQLFIDDPLNPKVVAQRTAGRVPFFEIKEIAELEKKEMKIIKQQIGKEIRDMCRESLDEYVDCMIERTFTFLRCRSLAHAARRCIEKYETREFLDQRIAELKAQREAAGLSLLRRNERQPYNKFLSNSQAIIIPKPE